jgi:hypothetical protein
MKEKEMPWRRCQTTKENKMNVEEMRKVVDATGVHAEPHPLGQGGQQLRIDYPNDYGASVVWFPGSYGYEAGLLGLAVFYDGDLCYDTPITNNVIGHLTGEEVCALLEKIFALPERDAARDEEMRRAARDKYEG